MRIRPYQPSDRAACLAVFHSNTPDFFLPVEEADFTAFLDRMPGPYLVVEEDDEIVACGGHAVNAVTGVATLCWGMVARAHQRRGLGRALLRARLANLADHPEAKVVRLDTSQHSRGFFEREGFVVQQTIQDGYDPGLDRCKLERILN
jgi:ribosomal protein S18 acetylase RimI-like enzyme